MANQISNLFVAQAGGEVGGSDMWWNPWMVIRIDGSATPDDIIKALEGVDPGNFFDAQDNFDWNLLVSEIMKVLSAAGYPVLSVEKAQAVHLLA